MEKRLTRRTFIGTLSVAALGAVGLAGCDAPSKGKPKETDSAINESEDTVQAQAADVEPVSVDETLTADVAVIGLGASGIMAAVAAGREGASVVAVDVAPSINGTGNINTTAPSAFGSKAQERANPDNVTTPQEAYRFLLEQTHYQENSQLLLPMLERSALCVDAMVDFGMPFMFTNTLMSAEASINDKTGAIYMAAGEERGKIWEAMLADAGVDTRFGLRATELLFDEKGRVEGVRCEGATVIDVIAQKVVLCTGGFLANQEMVEQYYAGAKMLSCGDQNAKGDGITMALSAGGQMGKNFTVSMNEFGGANLQVSSGMRYVFGDLECNGALRMAIMGLPMVDAEGKRFFDESIVRDRGMFAGEPLIRNSTYYAVCDQAFIDRVKSEPLSELLAVAGKAAKEWKAISAMTLDDIEDDIAIAIEEGWAAKGDTLADLGATFDLPCLEETIGEYNEFCQKGADERFFADPASMVPVSSGPFYAIQFNPSAWLSLGGIKTNASCQVLDAGGKPVDNLYVAGADADLWAVPYVTKGSANGFCLASGWLAGESAAKALSL